MVRIKNEHDLETLRQIALLVDNENQRLVNENVRLRVELARLHGVPETEQLELSVLKQLQEKRESIFRIDEKRTRKKTKAKKNKKKGHGPREQPHLPVVDKVIELAETEKKCSVCDGEMAGQYEESEVVTVVKRSFVIERHLRKKYRCRCNANVVTAPAATKLQPGGRYSVEFATEVAISKYLDHMPLERQVRMMRREGLDIDSQTLWDQLNVLARHLNPVYDALGEKVLESPVIHADETRNRRRSAVLHPVRDREASERRPQGLHARSGLRRHQPARNRVTPRRPTRQLRCVASPPNRDVPTRSSGARRGVTDHSGSWASRRP